ncbi:aromatic-ring-hydroxylating dioxygenase subunit beta [Streptomyces sp. FxanaA7]|uniref:aromatic-ring-hydroxylating dioxygenase subunit beta n=1 Tax=Streptomyces sp. FxanaA7 TaxID=1265492 RepID=UPI0005EDF172|nr:aromatic-ring-hydroxylating dioxygenase subunit beta [Streptomyces sp. FxanaA7]
MTAPATTDDTALDLRQVEQFLYREARYADEHDYDAWEALWTDDALYWVPAGAPDGDPVQQMSVISDNRSRIATRLGQLRTGKRYAQSPPSHLRRIVSNVEILDDDDGDAGGPGREPGDLTVGANFVLVESRERGKEIWAGRTTYRLRLVEGRLRLAYKKVVLVDHDRALPTLSFLI